jgi:glycosyltransferase involved in cell wall biosynthesis
VVVGIYYAPDTTGIAPYTTHLCESLVQAGARVDAVVGVPHYPEWRVPPAYRRPRVTSEVRAGVALHRVRHVVPRRQNVATRAAYEASFGLAGWAASRRLIADAVIAVTPNVAAVPAAAAIARRSGAQLGVVVQDLVGRAASQSGVRGGASAAGVTSRLEARWLAHADLIGVIDEAFRPALIERGLMDDRLRLLPNFSHIVASVASSREARAELGWPPEKFQVVHTGNMGLKQHLENVVAAARLAARTAPDVEFVLVGDGSTRRALQAQAADLPNVRFVPPLPADRYPLALAAADCLLVNERPSVRDMSLPSKLTSYFAAARPVVAAVTDAGATAAAVQRSGAGVRVDPGAPAELVAAVLRLRADDALRATLAAAGREHAATTMSPDAARRRVVNFAGELLRVPVQAPA